MIPRPEWVPVGAWAAVQIGKRVFTNWMVVALIFVPSFFFGIGIWVLMNKYNRSNSVLP